ncbi:MAG TPA: hypothetical protein VGQ85_03210 [Candidatus Limnocylindrales bacterium]|nr:hypothetical protein [Candidatus Limnocylindrales bacterium]
MSRANGFRGRIFGLVVLAILIGTIALLVAGYGLAVGLGALAGLVLGFAVGLFAFFSTWQGRGQVTFGNSGSSGSWSYMSNVSMDETESPMENMRELSEVFTVDLGPVRSIIPVLATSVAAGLTLQLLDVELHEAGLALNLDMEVGHGVLMPPSMARVSITDEAGTAFRASAHSQGGSPTRVRVQVVAIPVPPTGTRNLIVRIAEFVDPPFPHMGRPVAGPWTFAISLPRE